MMIHVKVSWVRKLWPILVFGFPLILSCSARNKAPNGAIINEATSIPEGSRNHPADGAIANEAMRTPEGSRNPLYVNPANRKEADALRREADSLTRKANSLFAGVCFSLRLGGPKERACPSYWQAIAPNSRAIPRRDRSSWWRDFFGIMPFDCLNFLDDSSSNAGELAA